MRRGVFLSALVAAGTMSAASAQTAREAPPAFTGLKAEVVGAIDDMQRLTQEIVDSQFSFSELGFQELETQRYLTALLKRNGFEVETGLSGMPSSWWATWGSGEPVIALGSDVDGLPKASQMPGVAYREPMIEGGPGHGEGHNSGQAVNIVAALAVKRVMQRERMSGTIVLWPGIAEELLSGKAWFVRDGRFKDVDAVLFTHVANNLGTSWGNPTGTGLISAEYTFEGISSHSAVAPWRGRSALDAVELMNTGWNFRREHLDPAQRSHYVIIDGGDQPNVVPPTATVWYYVRELTADKIRENFATLHRVAEGAALMTDTTMSRRVVGSAWPQHYNRPIALAMDENIKAVGLPDWSDDDQVFARALQKLLEVEQKGLATKLIGLRAPSGQTESSGSDDIGDVSWSVPTVTLRFPSNVDGMIPHHWSSAMAMATPIAHKGATAGAKVIATTLLDLLQNEMLRTEAWRYFREEQSNGVRYEPFISASDQPPSDKNADTMAAFRDRLRALYYDPAKHRTYLDQLGIKYPQLEKPGANTAP